MNQGNYETIAIIQEREYYGLALDGTSGGCKEWSDAGCILKLVLTFQVWGVRDGGESTITPKILT